MSRNRGIEGVLRCLICVFLVSCMPRLVFPQESYLGALHSEGGPSSSESPSVEAQNRTEWTIDFSTLMVSPGITWPAGRDWRVGTGIGVGDDLLGFMAVGGSHYSEPGWWSYEDRDGADNKNLFDILHAKVFARFEPFTRWQFDVGLHGSVFLHFDSSDDDPGGGMSVAAYALPVYGWRRIKIGPRIMAGYFRGCHGASEFGVKVSPLIVRVAFR